jgi:hypothetical protein
MDATALTSSTVDGSSVHSSLFVRGVADRSDLTVLLDTKLNGCLVVSRAPRVGV